MFVCLFLGGGGRGDTTDLHMPIPYTINISTITMSLSFLGDKQNNNSLRSSI